MCPVRLAPMSLGEDVDDKYNLFPIPESELTNNPTLVQNDGYKVIIERYDEAETNSIM